MNIISLFDCGLAKKSRVFVSLSLLWLCGCSGLGGGLFGDPCCVGPVSQPVNVGNDCTCGQCNQSGPGLFAGIKRHLPKQCPLRPVRHFPKRRSFQSRRVIDDSSYFSSVGKHRHRGCVDECCSVIPSCAAPPTCVAPVSCAAPEPTCVPDVCVPAPACAAPARCVEVPSCTAPVSCAAPSYCTDSGNYQFPECVGSNGEAGHRHKGNRYESDLPSVWNQQEKEKVQAEEPIQLPAPKSQKKVTPPAKKKPAPKKVPAPPKKFLDDNGAAFVPPLVPPTR